MNEQLKITITAVVDSFKQHIKDVKTDLGKFKDQVKEASEHIDEDFKKAGESISNGLKIGLQSAAALGAALAATAATTKEYRENQAKLITAFEAAGGSAADAAQAYNDLYRVLGDDGQATEAAAHLAKLTTEEKALSEWTNICQGVYATFGDSLPIEGLTEAANETAKVGTVTGTLADALNWAGISEDAFNESLAACNTEAEREALIRETLNGLYTDAATKYEENNADVIAQNEAQAKLSESLAKVGAAAQPVLTLLMQLATDVLSVLTPYIQDFGEKYLPTIKKILGGVGEALSKVLGFMIEHKTLMAVIATIIGTVVAAITLYNAVAAIKAAMDAAQVTTIWGLVSAHAAQAVAAMAAIAPYLLIVAAIAAVIAIIVLCVKYWDEIVAAVKKAIGAIKDVLKSIGSWINNNVIQPIINFFNSLGDKIRNIFNKIVEFFKGCWEKITGIFKKVGTAISDAITGSVKKAINSVLSGAIKIINGFISAINAAIGLINKIPGVNISKLNKLEVPKLARGGVIDRTTLAVVGEQGKEAVVPLENNLEWLDKLANMLNARMGGNSGRTIILQVDGRTLAQATVDSINDLTRQTGALPIKIM